MNQSKRSQVRSNVNDAISGAVVNEQTITILFQQVLEQVEQFSQLTELMDRMLTSDAATLPTVSASSAENQQQWRTLQRRLSEQQQRLQTGLQRLRNRISQLELLQSIAEHYDAQVDIIDVLDASLDALWQKVPLRFAVIVLGEAELGPYIYQSFAGFLMAGALSVKVARFRYGAFWRGPSSLGSTRMSRIIWSFKIFRRPSVHTPKNSRGCPLTVP